MLDKLAEIASYADQSKNHEVADNVTKLLKEAALWDALRTLFDPEHTPGLDRNTPFWKRLSKGWSRGKMDRNLGLVLAIMTERTKLNEKINKLTAPVKEFQTEVGSFYDRLHSGNIKSDNFKEEARNLQRGLKETLNLITGKDLRQILKMRERLEDQQLVAAEKIKGLDEETKNNLMAVLRGESLPGVMPGAPEAQLPLAPSESRLRSWLKKFNIARLPFNQGAQSKAGQHQFREFMQDYGFHPKAITDYFMANANAQAEGFALSPKEFGEMLRRAQEIQRYDDEMGKGIHKSQQSAKQQVPGTPEQKGSEEYTEPMTAAPTPATEMKEPPIDPEAEKQREMRRRQEREEKEKRNDLIKAIQERMEKQQAAPTIPASPLATSKAERTAREITRFGRVRQLNKLAGEGDSFGGTDPEWSSEQSERIEKIVDEEQLIKEIENVEKMMKGQRELKPTRSNDSKLMDLARLKVLMERRLKMLRQDVYEALPEGRERFHEEKHFDPEEVEFYKGRKSDEDYFDEIDMRVDPMLTPEDDDYKPERKEPKLPSALPQEELAELVLRISLVDKRIQQLLARPTRDNEYSDTITLDRLRRQKELLEDTKEQLIDKYNLPPDF